MESAIDQIQTLISQLGWLRLDLLGRLLLATVLGGLIGLEREFSGKPAGLRTNLLICVGAALLADLSVHFSALSQASQIRADPARLAAQIVSGIGFLGAGTIIQARGSVTGLTTAATLWVVAAIGIAVGSAAYVAAVGTAALVLMALAPMGWLEEAIRRRQSVRSGRVVMTGGEDALERLNGLLEVAGLDATLTLAGVDREAGTVTVDLHARGARTGFEALQRELASDPTVRSLRLPETA